jgi:carbonic anhydrase
VIRAAAALRRLVEGNARFVRGTAVQRPPTAARLAKLAVAQHPFAAILGCSDSRVPPEIVFDQGPGELFVVRVAGNVVGTETLGSLGYALAHLRTPLFVVLGHEGCGAVAAALRALDGATETGSLGDVLDAIVPALADVDRGAPVRAQLHRAVEANVVSAVRRLATNPHARPMLDRSRIRIVGAVYELESGRVRFLGDDATSATRCARPRRGSSRWRRRTS